MNDKTIFKTGVIGTGIAAVCCFTPFLVVVLGAVGLSAWLAWLDYVLLPALGVFIVIAAYGFYRLRSRAGATSEETT